MQFRFALPAGSARVAASFVLGLASLAPATPIAAGADPDRWESAIRKFEAADKDAPPPSGAALFIGSSSIRMWDVRRSFPKLEIIRRGFGGSQIEDSIRYADRIVIPYAPSVVVLYAGDNDIAAGKTPETVHADFVRFTRAVHEKLPDTRIAFIAIKPSLARWKLVPAMRDANARIRRTIDTDSRLSYIDIDTPMIGDDGRPRPELFVRDGLHLSAKGYELWASRVRPHLEGEGPGAIDIATCQFPVSGDIAKNADWIRRQMRAAKNQGADVAHFPEAALSGYAGVDYDPDEHTYDHELHRKEFRSILSLARELELWVMLGADHALSEGRKPHNSLYAISPRGEIVDRYDKRFCTGGDLRHYSPGDHLAVFDIGGVRCGMLICYDVRFPELYRAYRKRGVRLIFQSFHNARQKEGSIHPDIMPASLQTRAATNYFFISATNSSAPRSWPGLLASPDGRLSERLETDRPGVKVHRVDARRRYYDASRPYRARAIDGTLHSGQLVEDPRSTNRREF